MATAQKNPRAREHGGTFRIVVGDHIGDGPPGCECDDCLKSGGKDHRYRARLYDARGKPMRHDGQKFASEEEAVAYDRDYDNDIIESPKADLVARFNFYPFSIKFERINEQVQPSQPAEYPLERMSVSQMFAVAADEGINVEGATTREQIIRCIEAGRNGGGIPHPDVSQDAAKDSSGNMDELEELNREALLEMAESEGVHLPRTSHRGTIIRAIREARKGSGKAGEA